MSTLAIVFLRPELLFLLLLLPLLWFLPRRLEDPGQGLLRTLLFAFLILAMAGPVQIHRSLREHQVVILDQSASVTPEQNPSAVLALGKILSSMPPSAHKSLLVLAEEPLALPPKIRSGLQNVRRLPASLSLALALEQANRLIPEGSRGAVTLISDGLSTDHDWGAQLEALTARGIPLHTIQQRSIPTARITDVRIPSMLRVGHKSVFEVRLRGTQTRMRLALRQAQPDQAPGKSAAPVGPVLAQTEPILVNGSTVVHLEFTPRQAGFAALMLMGEILEGHASPPAALQRPLSVAIQDPLELLYLGGRLDGGAQEMARLLGPGFDVKQANQGESAPDLASVDMVLLDDVAEKQIPRPFQQGLVDAVMQQGLGLCMSGGRNAFGPGGWQKSPVAKILPVDLAQKEEKKDPSTALAVIIDTSGSMGGNRITLAKEVARLAIRRLLPHDKVGIVEFYGTKHWAAPLQSAANAIEIQRALNRLDAGGGTILYPAVQEAYYGLRNVQTRYKHVMILTDAGVESGPYEKLLRRMARDGIRVSTVLVGPGRHSEFLVELADWGKGRYYNASDRFNLPEVLLKQPSSSRLPAYRPGPIELELSGGPGWWGGPRPESLPALDGYVETRNRAGAEVLIKTRREGHPILASWRYGLGRVTSLATEPVGPGSRSLDAWKGYGSFLARVLSRTARASLLPFRFETRRQGLRVEVRAVALVTDAGRPAIWHLEESGKPRPLRFHEAAPGMFLCRFTASRKGPLRFWVAQADRPDRRQRLVLAANADSSPELQVDPSHGLDLDRASQATGGRHLVLSNATRTDDFSTPAGGGQVPLALRDFAPWALLLALITLLLEILWRRLPSRSQWAPNRS